MGGLPSKRNGPGTSGPFCVPSGARSLALAFACVLACLAGAAQADAQAGRVKARACVVCHGEFGASILPNTPNLAGQPEVYLMEQLKAYRSGKRAHEMMSLIAKPLTDDEIADLSAWFASIAIEVKPPK